MPRVGVLSLQGGFREHVAALEASGAEVREVRLPADLAGLDGLILPGGESTVIGKLMVEYRLLEPLRQLAREGLPCFGTCAGMILLARAIGRGDQPILGVLDIVVERNAYGRQLDSFEAEVMVHGLDGGPMRAIFIRAPRVVSCGKDVQVLARLDEGRPVAVRQQNLLATAFHPELTDDRRLHEYFLTMTGNDASAATVAASASRELEAAGGILT